MKRNLVVFTFAVVAIIAFTFVANPQASSASGRGDGPVVYVTSQGLAYDSIVLTDLPMEGDFQQLVPGGPTGLQTAFGPGDTGYLGGRWWLDANGNGEQDTGDLFFMCPLLGPGFTP